MSHGLIFLIFFYIFMKYIWREAASGKTHHETAARRGGSEESEDSLLPLPRSVLYIVVGLSLLVAGGEFIVDGASGIARTFGVSERLIGLLIVGPGTSVPELVALLDDERGIPRVPVANALWKINQHARAIPALISAARDNAGSESFCAAIALGQIGPAAKRATPTLLKLLEHPEQHVRKVAAAALKKVDSGS